MSDGEGGSGSGGGSGKVVFKKASKFAKVRRGITQRKRKGEPACQSLPEEGKGRG